MYFQNGKERLFPGRYLYRLHKSDFDLDFVQFHGLMNELEHDSIRAILTKDLHPSRPMKNLGEWGTMDEMFKFANILYVHVMVWSKFGHTMTWPKVSPRPAKDRVGERLFAVYLFHKNQNHFDLAFY
jgi:hypothetical protein